METKTSCTPRMLTAYEKYGTVGMEEYIDMYIDEELIVDISMLSDYNEYLEDSNYVDDWIYDSGELEELISGMDPMEIFRLGCFSDNYYSSDYFKFDGYGNVQGMDEYEVVHEMEDDKDFLRWYIEENSLIDEDEAEECIEECNKLIEEGY